MADKKITQLTNITGANLVDADEFVVVDISADETKAITLGELKEAFDSGSGFVRITGDTMTGALDVQSTITADALTVDGDASAEALTIGTTNTVGPLTIGKDSPSSDIMIDVGNTKYSSTNASGESKIRFGWANHTAANIAAYKQSINRTGFKFYSELGFNVENLALTIDADGNLIPSGGVVFGSTGGSVTSKTLDDYEEGTWTPTDGSGAGLTFSNVVGTYTKIGRQVFVVCELQYPSTSNTNAARIDGLPFAADDSFRYGGVISYTTSTALGTAEVTNPTSTSICFRPVNQGSQVPNDDISLNVVRFTILYQTTA